MKPIKIFTLILAGVLGLVTSCKDDSLVLVPKWESAVHGFGSFAPQSPQNFVYKDPTVGLDVLLRWVSIDEANTVTKIDIYVLFDEPYTDRDGNPSIAQIGGKKGLLLTTLEGSAVPANRTDLTINFSQDAIYQLYKSETFDYDQNGEKTPVFANPAKPARTAASPFVQGDAFKVRWTFTTADGRVFNEWAASVCTEFPGANCAVRWGVICTSNLAGIYKVVSTFDSPGYFTSANPDFQYGPGNDGSVANGVQTYNNIAVVKGTATATYLIKDITNGFEPIMWGNPPVDAIIADKCGDIVMSKLLWKGYAYEILPGSKVNANGFTIIWKNKYGENGVSTFTRQ